MSVGRFAAVLVAAALVGFGCGASLDGFSPETPGYAGDLYDPTEADETVPEGYEQIVPRDAIRPVYSTEFVAAPDIPWEPEALVIGVDLAGEARAYPVGFLNAREMVIDNHRGIPTLVSW